MRKGNKKHTHLGGSKIKLYAVRAAEKKILELISNIPKLQDTKFNCFLKYQQWWNLKLKHNTIYIYLLQSEILKYETNKRMYKLYMRKTIKLIKQIKELIWRYSMFMDKGSVVSKMSVFFQLYLLINTIPIKILITFYGCWQTDSVDIEEAKDSDHHNIEG